MKQVAQTNLLEMEKKGGNGTHDNINMISDVSGLSPFSVIPFFLFL
jgi:hypothetical protein